MTRLTDRKIILVTRPTRLAELVARFNTVSQARFYIEHQGADFDDYLREDGAYVQSISDAKASLDQLGRVQTVDRSFLPNFVFGPDDTIVAMGQDGLVANTIKYLQGQPVIGVNPDPSRWDGQLLPFRVWDLAKIVPEVFGNRRQIKSVTMAKATLNNGQAMYAVNDLFIGPKSHHSARYTIRLAELSETHSSSGVIVSTGMGSSGWLKSLITGAAATIQSYNIEAGPASGSMRAPMAAMARDRKSKPEAKVKCEFRWDASHLFFTVREPFPTRTTGASLVFGRVTEETPLILDSLMAENGVIFSDGIEKDFLEFNSGTQAVIGIAERKGALVV